MNFYEKIDIHWIDLGVIICGTMTTLIRLFYLKKKDAKISQGIILTDFGNGSGLFLSVILMFSAISSDLLKALTQASKTTIFVAGFCLFLALLRELSEFSSKKIS